MIIMALDHVRDYFHSDAFLYDPLDLNKTTVALYFTRWITHFCGTDLRFAGRQLPPFYQVSGRQKNNFRMVL